MIEFPSWVARVQALWVLIGALLTGLAASVGIEVPDFLSGIFAQATFDAIITVVTAVFTFYQVIKAIFISAPKTASASVRFLSNGQLRSYVWNPFRISV